MAETGSLDDGSAEPASASPAASAPSAAAPTWHRAGGATATPSGLVAGRGALLRRGATTQEAGAPAPASAAVAAAQEATVADVTAIAGPAWSGADQPLLKRGSAARGAVWPTPPPKRTPPPKPPPPKPAPAPRSPGPPPGWPLPTAAGDLPPEEIGQTWSWEAPPHRQPGAPAPAAAAPPPTPREEPLEKLTEREMLTVLRKLASRDPEARQMLREVGQQLEEFRRIERMREIE